MNNSLLYYSVGALLYSPANNTTIVNSITTQRFGNKYSLALCLEDTINDNCVSEAENILADSIKNLYINASISEFYIPKIFVRVRKPEQILRLHKTFGKSVALITGYIIPKFCLENADNYINQIVLVNEHSKTPVYMMPIYESASIVDLRKRYDILYSLKDKLDNIDDRVLNIRVGGNDLCNVFGFRRHDNESIHKIRPISNIFSDIITVYGTDYVVSGPVYEYFNGDNWTQGFTNEINDDRLCGFVGKTVIHPNQIQVLNEAYKVPKSDYDDACSILNWNMSSNSLVSASMDKKRMNECKTHSNWALKTLLIAEHFGIKT